MKYVALLRGINVGGKTMVKMADLKTIFQENGYQNVLTYINSGNVLFESEEKDIPKLVTHIESVLEKTLHMPLKIVVRNQREIQQVLEEVPDEWKKENKLRCYIGFVKDPLLAKDVEDQFIFNDAVDSLKAGKHVVYMSTKLEGLTKSGFTKMVGTKIFQQITIRNINTTKKLLNLMETK